MTVEIRQGRRRAVRQPRQGGVSVPSIDTKNVTTQIAVNNGDTAVIGGIYEETINNDVTKVPVPRRHSRFWATSFKTTGKSDRQDRAADLPHATDHQGIGYRGALARRSPAPARASDGGPRDSCSNRRYSTMPSMQLHRGNLFLVGMPGCGKSTLGRLLARRLDKPFFDADVELERRLGVSIPVIFELEGEPGFRDREETILAELVVSRRTSCLPPAAAPCCVRPTASGSSKAERCSISMRRRQRCGSAPATASIGRCCRLPDPFARACRSSTSIRDPLYREVADCRRRIGSRAGHPSRSDSSSSFERRARVMPHADDAGGLQTVDALIVARRAQLPDPYRRADF